MKTGIELIAQERQRQIDKEGYTSEHDWGHGDGSIAHAAACYAMPLYKPQEHNLAVLTNEKITPEFWPWDNDSWKPKNRLADLIRAGALIAAEIDRLQNQ